MAGVTGRAIVLITGYALVVLCKRGRIIVFVANNTAERLVIARCGVAFGALVPLVFVLPAVNGEIHIVVVKSRRLPSRFIMAKQAVRGELRRLVVGVVD